MKYSNYHIEIEPPSPMFPAWKKKQDELARKKQEQEDELARKKQEDELARKKQDELNETLLEKETNDPVARLDFFDFLYKLKRRVKRYWQKRNRRNYRINTTNTLYYSSKASKVLGVNIK